MQGLPGLKKGVAKPRSLKKLPGIGPRYHNESPLPKKQVQETVDLRSDREADIANELHDAELAHRVVSLLKKHPYGTVPEMLALDWLEKNLKDYVYQAEVNGGYRPGGLIPDFVVSTGGSGIAIDVQGDYYHNLPGKPTKDETDRLRLLGQRYQGVTIDAVIFVWESRLKRSKTMRDQVMEAAVQRQEMGPA